MDNILLLKERILLLIKQHHVVKNICCSIKTRHRLVENQHHLVVKIFHLAISIWWLVKDGNRLVIKYHLPVKDIYLMVISKYLLIVKRYPLVKNFIILLIRFLLLLKDTRTPIRDDICLERTIGAKLEDAIRLLVEAGAEFLYRQLQPIKLFYRLEH